MAPWRPRIDPDCDRTHLLLDPAAGSLLARIDGQRSVTELSRATGLSEHQVHAILDDLVSQGAVVPGQAAPGDEPAPAARNHLPPLPDPPAEAPLEPQEPGAEEALAEDLDPDPDPAEEALDEAERASAGTHRKLYEGELKKLERDMRMRLASKASDPVLSALCFDPEPGVIGALLDNLRFGLAHARLVAAHHHSAAGLEALSRRSQFASDGQVTRLLMRNQQTPDAVFRKLFSPRPLMQVFKFCLGREATDRAKRLAREILRQKFQRAAGEESAGLVFQSEGRCLRLLVGLHFDPKATALLCRRTYNSSILIQNLARFPGTPPKLIEHLLRQQLVRRQVQLRQLLQRHSNCPSALKR